MRKTNAVTRDMIIALLPVFAMAVYYYGQRVLVNAGIAIAAGYFLDRLFTYLHTRSADFHDFSAIYTGAVITLMFPASASCLLVLTATVFGIIIVKAPFGGTGKNIFSPEAAGFCFCAVAWTAQTFSYPAVERISTMFGAVETKAQSSIAAEMARGTPNVEISDILLGNVRGAAGTTCVLILFACSLFVAARHIVSFKQTAAILISVGLIAFLFPRCGENRLDSVFYELTSGFLLFGAVFLAGDDSSSPTTELGKVFFGIFIGGATMLFRHFGTFEVGFPFALIVANAVVPFFDKHSENIVFSLKTFFYGFLFLTAKNRKVG